MAFCDRMMLRDPNNPYNILGNTQRSDFIPYLKAVLNGLNPEPRIFDVGGGAGELVDILISKLPSAKITIEEPNIILLEEYRKRIKKYPHLRLDSSYEQPIQELYHSFSAQQDLILAIHMIYFLTNHRNKKNFSAQEDLIKFISFLYGLLSNNGKIFLVYADQQNGIGGKVAKHYFSQYPNQSYICQNLDAIWDSRRRLLENGGICEMLNKLYPKSNAKIKSDVTSSYIYGKSLEDIAIMCIAGELGCSDDKPFDTHILEVTSDFVNKHGKEIGLTIEKNNCPQKEMYRCNQPQVICTITRT